MTAVLRVSVCTLAAVLLSSPFATARLQESEKDLASPKLRIEWTEFKKLYDAKGIVVVDVRGQDAFKAGHIPGARSIPLDDVAKRAGELRKLKKPIVTYCA